ncbi:MAG: hypothetical protein R3E73_09695 [Porticoccaceae bacterium]
MSLLSVSGWSKNNIDFVATREPGGNLAESIRELLLSNRDEEVDEKTASCY